MNQCESEGLADAFVHHGFSVVKSSEEAEIYIVNTCTVTSKAEQKARRMIRKYAFMAHRPVVIVTGCYAQMEPELIAKIDESLFIVPLEKKANMLQMPMMIAAMIQSGISLREAVSSWIKGEQSSAKTATPFDYHAITFIYHARAFLKIEDGCDNSCAYCRVTLARGPATSLDADEVLERCLEIERQGYREIVLTGVNITAYASNGLGLDGLLKMLLGELSDRTRIRLSSLEPDMITDSLIECCKDHRVQPHFHIPVQTASNRMLISVNRHYTVDLAADRIQRLKQVRPDAFLAADIITGLPGESEEDFQQTVDFLKRMGFSQIHVFPFSPRPGTALYDAKHKVPEFKRDERASLLRDLSRELHQTYIARCIGKETEVIIESMREGNAYGVSANYLKMVVTDIPDEYEDVRGRMCRVMVDRRAGILIGRFIEFI